MSPPLPDRRDRLGALGAAVALTGLVAGVPVALVRAGGPPWDVPLPGGDAVGFALRTGHVPGSAWIEGLLLVSWLAWMVLAAAIVAEAAALTRHGVSARLPGLAGIQAMVRPLLLRSTLLVSLFASAPRPVAAVPLAEVAISADVAQPGAAGHASIAAEVTRGSLDVVDRASDRGPTVTTARRDTLRRLADTHLGDAERWREIRSLNAGRTMPDGTVLDDRTTQLRAGWPLLLPGDAVVEAEPGDHLWGLAEAHLEASLGREASDEEIAPYWLEVVDRNLEGLAPPRDPDLLLPGHQVVLPEPAAGAAPADTPSTGPSLEEALAHERERMDVDTPSPMESGTDDGDVAVPPTEHTAPSVASLDSDAALPDPAQPGTAQPGTAQPGTARPDPAQPDPARPDTEAIIDTEVGADGDGGADDEDAPAAPFTTSWATRAGAGLVAAGLAAAVVRARTRRESSRRLGEGDPDVDDRLLAVEGSLLDAADDLEFTRAARALQRSVDRLAPLDEPFVPPRLVVIDGVDFVVHRTDGSTVSFEQTTLDGADVFGRLHETPDLDDRLAPGLVPLGAGAHLDLETVAVLGLTGDRRSATSLARAIVHHLTLGPARNDIDVRCSAAVAREVLGGRDADNHLLADEIARWSERVTLRLEAAGAQSARRLRLEQADRTLVAAHGADALTPLVVVIDEAERDEFASVLDLAVASRLPLAVVVVHAAPVPVETQVHLDSELSATLLPDGTSFVPCALPAEVAEEFAELVNRIDTAPLRFRPPLDDELAIDAMRAQDEVATLDPGGAPAPERPTTLSGLLGATRHGVDPLLEVAVLGSVEVHGTARPLSDDERSALCLLVIHGPHRPGDIDAALWPALLPDAARVDQLLDGLVGALGAGHLERTPDDTIAIRAVSCDLVRARSAVDDALGLDGAPRAAAWRQALSEIRGPAFDGSSWPWLAEHAYGTRGRATRLLVDAALTLAGEAELDGTLGELRLDLRRARRLAPWHEQLAAVALGLEGPTETDHGPSGPNEPPEEWQRAG